MSSPTFSPFKYKDSVSTNEAAAKLDAYADKTEITADGSSLSYITVDVKDVNNNIVAGANNRIDFSIEGEGIHHLNITLL